MFAYTIVYLTFSSLQIVVCAHVFATCSLRVRNRRVSCMPRSQQPDIFLSTVFESKEHGSSFAVFVGLRQRGC